MDCLYYLFVIYNLEGLKICETILYISALLSSEAFSHAMLSVKYLTDMLFPWASHLLPQTHLRLYGICNFHHNWQDWQAHFSQLTWCVFFIYINYESGTYLFAILNSQSSKTDYNIDLFKIKWKWYSNYLKMKHFIFCYGKLKVFETTNMYVKRDAKLINTVKLNNLC